MRIYEDANLQMVRILITPLSTLQTLLFELILILLLYRFTEVLLFSYQIIQMKNFTRILLLFQLFFFISFASFAQVRKYSNEFLSIGVGARALGMSNASIVSADDATAGYWNPAGLSGITGNVQLAAMHSDYFAKIAKYDFGAFATRIDSSSAMGVSFIRLAIDDIPNTIELIAPDGSINYDRIEKFSAADNAVLLSYARKTKIPGLRVGSNAKIVYRKVGDFAQAWGFGLDAGLHYDYKKWKLGAMIRDITGTFNAWSFDLSDRMAEVLTQTGNEVPENSLEITAPKIILGVARKYSLKEKYSLLAELDADITTDGTRNTLVKGNYTTMDPHFGIEAGYKNLVFIRGGAGNFQKVKSEIGNRDVLTFQPNIGIGLKIKNLSIDYALTDIGDQSVALYSNVFSLRLDLSKKAK